MFPLRTNTPIHRFPIFTLLIIVVDTILFSLIRLSPLAFRSIISQFGAIPYELTHFKDLPPKISPPVHFTLFSSMFLHGSWGHLLGNMWFLFIFGKNVEDWLGHRRYILFYLLCGIGATLVYVIFSPFSKIPLVGASGAIAGVLGAYFMLYPRSRVLCLIPVFMFIRITTVPAFLFLGLWVMWQFFYQVTIGHLSNVAFLAHIGGFFIGVVWIRWIKRKKFLGWREL